MRPQVVEAPNTWASEIDIQQDKAVQQNWGNLFSLLAQSPEDKDSQKGLIDQLVLQLADNWLDTNDQCGVYQDLLDIGLESLTGGTLGQIIGTDLSGYLPPGIDIEEALPEGGSASLVAGVLPSSSNVDLDVETAAPAEAAEEEEEEEEEPDKGKDGKGGDKDDEDDEDDKDKGDNIDEDDRRLQLFKRDEDDRRLQFFTEDSCSTFDSTVFLGSMLSFSSCANVDIGKFFGSVEENMVNVGLNCLNTFLQPFQRTKTCASRNFQNFVMDECVKGVVSDDIMGHIFQLFFVSPKQTCGCMASLATVPTCRVDVTNQISLDGMLTSKMACLIESQVCTKLEDECGDRLTVLNECLPELKDISRGNFDCEEVMCNCEQNDRGLLNYAGKAMELPMSDMCVERATLDFTGSRIPDRYAIFQEKCGAQFLRPPSIAPTISPAPSQSPTTEADNINRLIQGQQNDSQVNSVISGILLALAITGVASIFLVFVLVLWRRRFRSKGRQVRTIDEMKAHAQDQIRKLQEDVRRMEAHQGEITSESGNNAEVSSQSDDSSNLAGLQHLQSNHLGANRV